MVLPATLLPPPPVSPPAALMDGPQLREWLAALRGIDVVPCRQTIRKMREEGLPSGLIGKTRVYDAAMVWAWIQTRMVATDLRQRAIDAACARRGQPSRVA